MPANLTPEYEAAEQRYREARDDEQRLEALQEMLSTIPKHKGTEKMQADIKRRISQLRKAQARRPAKRGPDPFHVPRSGAGQVVLIGRPNVGKSMLLAATTNAPVKVAEYPYSTALPVPGMLQHEDVQIQLIDTPPMTAQNVPAGLLGTVRAAEVICIVADASAEPLEDVETVLAVLEDRGMVLRSAPICQLDRAAAQHSAIIIANKIDQADADTIASMRELYHGKLDILAVSAARGDGLEQLRQRLWQLLAQIRVYTKQPGKPPDRERPFTLPIGSSVADLARAIHRELPEKMKFARIWGDGRYKGQQVHRSEVLHDKDVVEIHE